MVFASSIFLFIFFPIFLSIYFLCYKNIKIQNLVTFIMSLIFYAWGGISSLLLLLFSIVVNFLIGILLDKSRGGKRKKYLIIAIVFNLGILGFFKYFNFIVANLLMLFGKSASDYNLPVIVLPIGISFFTFQILSYIIDLYWKNIKAQTNIIHLGLYIMLFPQLIAGPIVRYIDIENELLNRRSSADDILYGTQRFIIGLAKKVIIANTLGEVSSKIFTGLGYQNTLLSWMGAIAYTFQIFYDFSAYSDMSIGIGRIIGFHFNENFNYPYISKTVKEFWRRWHISLSSWFRDYVYIPLGGNRSTTLKTYRNLTIVFFLTGLWHGANWTFIIWGIWHGCFLILERITGLGSKINFPRWIMHIYTMLVVIVGWVLFNSSSISNALVYLKAMFQINFSTNINLLWQYVDSRYILCMVLGFVFSVPWLQNNLGKFWTKNSFAVQSVKNILLIVLYVITISFLAGAGFNPFIYFQF